MGAMTFAIWRSDRPIAASMESAISTSLLARRHQNGLPALTFHHVFAIVPDRGFDGIRDLDKLARPQAPERASCPDFSPCFCDRP
jgi:hypothetical protein